MKTAIYIEDGLTQLVLTPENDWEEAVVRGVEGGQKKVTVNHGSFYNCNGGWVRQAQGETSLIISVCFRPKDEFGLKTSDEIAL